MHPDADKWVPGAIWSDGMGEMEVVAERGDRGYLVKVVASGNVVGHEVGGWAEPHAYWRLVKEAPAAECDKAIWGVFTAVVS